VYRQNWHEEKTLQNERLLWKKQILVQHLSLNSHILAMTFFLKSIIVYCSSQFVNIPPLVFKKSEIKNYYKSFIYFIYIAISKENI
jgi:hypothetical protein